MRGTWNIGSAAGTGPTTATSDFPLAPGIDQPKHAAIPAAASSARSMSSRGSRYLSLSLRRSSAITIVPTPRPNAYRLNARPWESVSQSCIRGDWSPVPFLPAPRKLPTWPTATNTPAPAMKPRITDSETYRVRSPSLKTPTKICMMPTMIANRNMAS